MNEDTSESLPDKFVTENSPSSYLPVSIASSVVYTQLQNNEQDPAAGLESSVLASEGIEKLPVVELVSVRQDLPNMDLSEESSHMMEVKNEKQLFILTSALDTVQPLPDEECSGNEPAVKKFRIQGEDGQSYIIAVAENQLTNLSGNSQPSTLEHLYQEDLLSENAVRSLEKRNQLLGSDVSQAWFTTRDDKNILQNNGARWKQGQWTKDEVDLLQINISDYCRQHNISDPTEIIFEMSKDERKEFYRTVARGLQRPLFSVYRRVTRMYDQKNHMGKYSTEEMMKLRALRVKHGNDWATIGQALGRSASSVKDKCRLMKETCNSGKWLPEEEKRLSQSVYELVGCKPGEDVVHGLSWAQVATKVGTRSEKQCRTKWLNYMNWKQKGGKEWTREDDMNLIIRVSNMGVMDDTEIDWNELAQNWESVRSPQWLRGKWWSLKRHIPDYQLMPYNELLEHMKKFYLSNVRVRNTLGTARTRKMEPGSDGLTYVPISLNANLSGDSDLDETYEVLQQLPTSGSYIIAQSAGNHVSQSDHIIVQTGSDGDLQGHYIVSVPGATSLTDAVTPMEASDLGASIQLASAIHHSQQDLDGMEGGVISRSDSLSDTSAFPSHNLEEESVISSPGDKQITYIQASSGNGQLMTSFADPMLNSDSTSLIGSTSDVEADKNHSDDLIVCE